ncbi:SCAN domain-containing protein 3 [Trichonephila clavata]|uniref:SCAN domain-containing protein 3 n=1 Tax=Trichonephila clavata TaxID=2740835 RepID=A0A8X6FV40_TRICU|nr:SCAN domain-containing protein 3 [Trichonephila clavata]
MLFCKLLETTTAPKVIYNELKMFLDANNKSMKNITSSVADGAPIQMGKNNSLKVMEDENPIMLLVHCAIHRENLVAKNFSTILNK